MSSQDLTIKVIQSSLSKRQINQDLKIVNIWLQEYRNTPNTFISYNSAAERFIMWIFYKNISIKDVSREVIQEYQLFLAAPQPKDTWCGPAKSRNSPDWKPFVKALGNSSINLQIQILKSMYQYFVDYGYLVRNPFRLIRQKLHHVEAIERYLTHKELAYFEEYIDDLPPDATKREIYQNEKLRWLFSLLYFTACRRSEIINAKMSDFVAKRDQWWFKVTGKGSKQGLVPVTNGLLKALIRYRKFMGLKPYPDATETDIPVVFNNYADAKLVGITEWAIHKTIKNACKKISERLKDSDPASAFVFQHVSTHWLRHTSATHQVDAGIDIRTVKLNLRHSLLETTMRYQHTEASKQHAETISKFGKG